MTSGFLQLESTIRRLRSTWWGKLIRSQRMRCRKSASILGPTNRYSNKKRGMWPSCVERYTPKPVSQ
jgi:hypothetical protein